MEALLLHLEGELDSSESPAVVRHLQDCWVCRAQCKHLMQGICAFVEYHSEVQLPGVSSPPANPQNLRRRLQKEATLEEGHGAAGRLVIQEHWTGRLLETVWIDATTMVVIGVSP